MTKSYFLLFNEKRRTIKILLFFVIYDLFRHIFVLNNFIIKVKDIVESNY